MFFFLSFYLIEDMKLYFCNFGRNFMRGFWCLGYKCISWEIIRIFLSIQSSFFLNECASLAHWHRYFWRLLFGFPNIWFCMFDAQLCDLLVKASYLCVQAHPKCQMCLCQRASEAHSFRRTFNVPEKSAKSGILLFQIAMKAYCHACPCLHKCLLLS